MLKKSGSRQHGSEGGHYHSEISQNGSARTGESHRKKCLAKDANPLGTPQALSGGKHPNEEKDVPMVAGENVVTDGFA